MNDPLPDGIRFGADGLIPAVAQDAVTGDVLMLATMNDEALRLTYATGEAHYWSRSRQKLWRKGETSGHVQVVDEIRVNCERNSLLILVRQIGAVCHDGYPTCYYRRRAADGTMTVVRDRAFDPARVYGVPAVASPNEQAIETDPLAEATRLQFGAYGYLRDHDLSDVSRTSKRLRDPNEDVASRIADELRELAGVLDGDHRHRDRQSDLMLEASQVVYWILLEVLRSGATWARLRPDRALMPAEEPMVPATVARLLRADADRWAARQVVDAAAAGHATLGIVAQACLSGGVDPSAAVTSDLNELRARPYLAAYFGREEGNLERDQQQLRTATT